MAAEKFKIAIIGAGPGGMSAAARASQLGLSHVLLESASHAANTIRHFQVGKLVMAEPSVLPLRSALSFGAGMREDILRYWKQELQDFQVNLRTNAAATSIAGQRGDFTIGLASGATVQAETIVLAIGVQGNIRRLDVPGDDLPGVQYQLDDPDEFKDETIVVVGAGDAGVENALALAQHNRVILINRSEAFTQCRSANFNQLMIEVTKGRIETRVNTRAERIKAGSVLPLRFIVRSPHGLEQIDCHRIIARLGAKPPRQLVEGFGVQFPNADANAVPQLSEQYESNVPGLYIVGALAGYPLIKQALNQGYEVVEYIAGNEVEPADEELLRKKFTGVPGIASVREGIELVRQRLQMFAEMTTLQLREFMLDSEIRTFRHGEVIFTRNDYSSSFYSVLAGSVSIEAVDKDGEKAVYRIAAGNFFGEMGLLSGRRRSGTAIAGEGCVLVETPRNSMLKLMHAVPGTKRRLDSVALKRIVQNSLEASLPDAEFDVLTRGAELKSYAVGEALFNEGDPADGIYLIRRGSVTVSRTIGERNIVLAYVPAGQYVGEMALVSGNPRSATVRAASPTEAVRLDAEQFRTVMQRNEKVRAKVNRRYLERIGSSGLLADEQFDGLVRFLMEQGVGEATDVLMIDYSQCIRCNHCETACADGHGGVSRLNREAGPTFEQIHVPVSCRHCEHPHCMKDCPPDAIHRSVGGEVVVNENCIGCGNCERNCPYGAIHMAVPGKPIQRGFWQMLFGGEAAGAKATAEKDAAAKRAVKCDLCQGLDGGPWCVNACPTGAAFRTSPEEFFHSIGRMGTSALGSENE